MAELSTIFSDRSQSAVVAGEAEKLIDQLRMVPGVQGAWDDLIEVIRAGKDLQDLELAATQLKELVKLRGHDWFWMRKELDGLIDHGDLANARSRVAEDAPDDITVVWVAFGNAHLDRPFRRIGQIQFFADELDLQEIRDGCPALNDQEFEAATELSDSAISMHFKSTDAEHAVFARVELASPRAKAPPQGRSRQPIEWGRDLASATVEAAAFRYGGSAWTLLEGGCYFTASGTSGGSTGFDDPFRMEIIRNFKAPINELTSLALNEFSQAFVDALTSEDKRATLTMERVRWHNTVSKTKDPALRLVNFIKTFEDEWSEIGDNWEDSARHYLRDHWCRDMQNNALFRAGWIIHDASKLLGVSSLEQAAQAVYKAEDGMTFSINLLAVSEQAQAAAEKFDRGTIQRRRLREIARATQDGKSAQNWWSQLRCDFDMLLNRGVRQRNRIVHGGKPLLTIVNSCEPFIAQLASSLVAEAIEGVSQDRSSKAVICTRRNELAKQFEDIAGGSFSDLLS
ncbi:MAG TPA: hypothetical protein VND98_10550 [Solirubrobacterales bacterium]|nr:hypothetical protein [Solirubrobacterales bacterium]